MNKALLWFARIWLAAVILLNLAGSVGIILRAPDAVTAWIEITDVYSPFNLWTHGLNLVLVAPGIAALWIRARREARGVLN